LSAGFVFNNPHNYHRRKDEEVAWGTQLTLKGIFVWRQPTR